MRGLQGKTKYCVFFFHPFIDYKCNLLLNALLGSGIVSMSYVHSFLIFIITIK